MTDLSVATIVAGMVETTIRIAGGGRSLPWCCKVQFTSANDNTSTIKEASKTFIPYYV